MLNDCYAEHLSGCLAACLPGCLSVCFMWPLLTAWVARRSSQLYVCCNIAGAAPRRLLRLPLLHLWLWLLLLNMSSARCKLKLKVIEEPKLSSAKNCRRLQRCRVEIWGISIYVGTSRLWLSAVKCSRANDLNWKTLNTCQSTLNMKYQRRLVKAQDAFASSSTSTYIHICQHLNES